MKPTITATAACLVLGSIAIAATTTARQLTPRRIAELTAPVEAPKPTGYKVEITGLESAFPSKENGGGPANVILSADKPQGVLEHIRELRFPSSFTPPTADAQSEPTFQPTWPAEFETVNTGWTIRLSAKPYGKVIVLSGIADYTEGELISGGYGALAEPIHAEDGKLLSPNVIHQPKLQTTTTRFQVFAVPGEAYEVTLYRGAKAEKHRITLTTQ